MKLTMIAAVAAALLATNALASGSSSSAMSQAQADAAVRASLYAAQRARLTSITNSANRNTATGGAAEATGGNAVAGQAQTQGSVTGRQSARTGDVSSNVTVEGDRNDYPVNSAYAAPGNPSAPCIVPYAGGGSSHGRASPSIRLLW